MDLTWDKGDAGERIGDAVMKRLGCARMRPGEDGCPHEFDRVYFGPGGAFCMEWKTKPRRRVESDTGFDTDYEPRYLRARRLFAPLPFRVGFIDEAVGWLYGQEIGILLETFCVDNRLTYPLRDRGITYFSLLSMLPIARLTTDERLALRALSSGSNADHPLEFVPAHVPFADAIRWHDVPKVRALYAPGSTLQLFGEVTP